MMEPAIINKIGKLLEGCAATDDELLEMTCGKPRIAAGGVFGICSLIGKIQLCEPCTAGECHLLEVCARLDEACNAESALAVDGAAPIEAEPAQRRRRKLAR